MLVLFCLFKDTWVFIKKKARICLHEPYQARTQFPLWLKAGGTQGDDQADELGHVGKCRHHRVRVVSLKSAVCAHGEGEGELKCELHGHHRGNEFVCEIPVSEPISNTGTTAMPPSEKGIVL